MSTTDSKAPTVAAGSRALPCGVIKVTVTKFRSIGSVTQLEATLDGWTGFEMPHGLPLPQPPPKLTLVGNAMKVTSEHPVSLIFNLPDSRHIFIGAAWQANNADNDLGEKVFPEVLVRRGVNQPRPYRPPVPGGSCMIVTDNANLPGSYEYILMFQDGTTGEIGILDPTVDNNPQGH